MKELRRLGKGGKIIADSIHRAESRQRKQTEERMKPPVLTKQQLLNLHTWLREEDKDCIGCLKLTALDQRDKDWEHEKQTVREIFEEIEKEFKGYIWNPLFTVKWQSFKSRLLEEKPKEDSCQK